MLKLARGSSNFSNSSVDYNRPVKPRKEAQKRKNVHFNDEPEIVDPDRFTMSTATFLRQRGIAWNTLAHTFGCDEDFTKDDAMVMSELLNLCSFWSDSEPIFEGAEEHSDVAEESDSDDDLECLRRLAVFSSSSSTGDRTCDPCSSSSSGISSLRLSSILRLNSQSTGSSMMSSETLSRFSSTSSNSSQKCPLDPISCSTALEKLENAFKGIMDDDNGSSRDSVHVPATTSDDFWSQVEF